MILLCSPQVSFMGRPSSKPDVKLEGLEGNQRRSEAPEPQEMVLTGGEGASQVSADMPVDTRLPNTSCFLCCPLRSPDVFIPLLFRPRCSGQWEGWWWWWWGGEWLQEIEKSLYVFTLFSAGSEWVLI